MVRAVLNERGPLSKQNSVGYSGFVYFAHSVMMRLGKQLAINVFCSFRHYMLYINTKCLQVLCVGLSIAYTNTHSQNNKRQLNSTVINKIII